MRLLNKIIIKECPTQCGVKNITYQAMVDTHFIKECPKINVKCMMKGCGEVFLRGYLHKHLS